MPRKPTRLTDMEYDEVSLVGIPANQHADIVLFKSYTKPEEEPTLIRRSRTGQLALAKNAVALSQVRKMSPDPSSVHEDSMMSEKDKKKRKKKKTKKKEKPTGDPVIEVSSPNNTPS